MLNRFLNNCERLIEENNLLRNNMIYFCPGSCAGDSSCTTVAYAQGSCILENNRPSSTSSANYISVGRTTLNIFCLSTYPHQSTVYQSHIMFHESQYFIFPIYIADSEYVSLRRVYAYV